MDVIVKTTTPVLLYSTHKWSSSNLFYQLLNSVGILISMEVYCRLI